MVVIAQAKHPAPFRTRPLSAVAPMVLHPKVWESRSPPNLIKPIMDPPRGWPISLFRMSHTNKHPSGVLFAFKNNPKVKKIHKYNKLFCSSQPVGLNESSDVSVRKLLNCNQSAQSPQPKTRRRDGLVELPQTTDARLTGVR